MFVIEWKLFECKSVFAFKWEICESSKMSLFGSFRGPFEKHFGFNDQFGQHCF